MLKVAYLCEPQVGGTYTTFKLLRQPLLVHDIDFQCICPFDGRAYAGGPFEKEDGVVYLPFKNDDPDEAARVIDDYLSTENIKLLMVLPEGYDVTPVLITRYGKNRKVVVHVDHITRGTYRPTAWLRPYADGILVVAKRHLDDLSKSYCINRQEIRVIWHGVKAKQRNGLDKQPGGPLRIGWLGRVEDLQKNVFILPKIASELNMRGYGNCYVLDVVGSGPDFIRLKEMVHKRQLERQVILHGKVSDADLEDLIAGWDIFLFPSRFEGFGFALAEAMAAGCVPVVSNIRGVFDHIVTEECGYIVKTVGAKGYADVLCELMDNREKLVTMSQASRERCVTHFSVERMAREHAEYFREIVARPPKEKPAKVLYRRRRAGDVLRGMIPMGVKKTVRGVCERIGIPV